MTNYLKVSNFFQIGIFCFTSLFLLLGIWQNSMLTINNQVLYKEKSKNVSTYISTYNLVGIWQNYRNQANELVY